ncbi:TPA: ammonium transporter [Salmonella enterica]|nr:ammonium transporter [Salmonella enterica]
MKIAMIKTTLASLALLPGLTIAAPAVADKADSAFMMICTALVLFMTIPGIALFYGGLIRAKNVLSMLTQVTVTFALVCILWVVYGYSLAFGEGNHFFGNTDGAMLKNIALTAVTGTIYQYIHVAFQGSFACITVGLIVGALAERIRFSAVLIFVVVWFTLSYIPIAHMVWGGGLLAAHGALDFAGGTVVHINAAIAGLVGAYLIGKRVGFGKEAFKPHNLPMVFTGTAILYIGWFGFNAGSAGSANEIAALAFVNTVVATAAAILGWIIGEWTLRGKPSLLGACSGAIAGLVGVTPACGYVGVGGALVIGVIAGLVGVTPACGYVGVGGALVIGVIAGLAGLWGVTMLKRLLRVDDPCDVFGVHGVCGIVGCILTGVFAASSLGGVGFVDGVTMGHQVMVQLESIAITVVWSGVVAFVGYKLADILVGLRVPEEQEREGLDVNSHGENAYNA